MTATPNHLALGELIKVLEAEPPDKRIKLGFTRPHSYRGYYEDLAFELRGNVTIGAMLADAKSALGATFTGWKGGDYVMSEWTQTWIVTERGDLGESLGALLLSLLLKNEV